MNNLVFLPPIKVLYINLWYWSNKKYILVDGTLLQSKYKFGRLLLYNKSPNLGNCSMQSTFSGHCNRFKHPLKGTPSRESALILPNFWALFTVLANGIPDYFFSFHVSKVFCFCLTLAFYFVHPWLFVIFLCPMSRLVPLADHPPPPSTPGPSGSC